MAQHGNFQSSRVRLVLPLTRNRILREGFIRNRAKVLHHIHMNKQREWEERLTKERQREAHWENEREKGSYLRER